MCSNNGCNSQRRHFLIKSLTGGALAATSTMLPLSAWSLSNIPKDLLPGKSVFDFRGDVKVDGHKVNPFTFVTSKSTIETGRNSHIIFAVGEDAFVLRSDSKMELTGDIDFLSGIRIISGKLLSVFGKRPEKKQLTLNTQTATIGIRGTGVYIEAEEEKTYACCCYGSIETSATSTDETETVVSTHHAPKYIYKEPQNGKCIIETGMLNHTDVELALLEALVKRKVPESFF
ncbi:MAG: hypothetical protein DIZ80_13685 [endosymbiont of Galathealinum brachiosum]|uniref:FecR protein domain-containing protein n=1 Tax=endosymbiont of Galathealinum brachiosum TaxID=2200906 RepID=A0A370D8D4_9GAMM|nr:MAG: hypothetical protein DIZ80_13685 [endosymbiont of Galathealinum brachiosum]